MSAPKPKGTAIWLFAFFSFLAFLSGFNAVMLLTLRGGDFIADFSIGGLALGSFNVMTYFVASITTTFILLGATFFLMFKRPPTDPNLLKRLARVEENLALNASMLENTQIGFFKRLEQNDEATAEAFRKINNNLEVARKMTNGAVDKQGKVFEEVQRESRENTEVIRKQAKDMAAVKKRVEKIRKALALGKAPKLRGKSKLEMVKDMKPKLAQELRNMGINNVSQFLTVDPLLIAEKTMEFPETVTNLQAKAQLLMVPGIDANDAELLVKAGITSRKELSNQDPVQLCRAVVGIANAYVEKGKLSPTQVPTIDNVWSWIKVANP